MTVSGVPPRQVVMRFETSSSSGFARMTDVDGDRAFDTTNGKKDTIQFFKDRACTQKMDPPKAGGPFNATNGYELVVAPKKGEPNRASSKYALRIPNTQNNNTGDTFIGVDLSGNDTEGMRRRIVPFDI